MPIRSRFAHVSITAHDLAGLARFYQDVFGCVIIAPVRDLAGDWLARGTGVPRAQIRGVHLQLPGYGEAQPALEILQYDELTARPTGAANRPGLGHLAFAVKDVAAAYEAVLAAGGQAVGRLTEGEVPGAGQLTFVYVTDPEGNIIELQRWARDAHEP